MACLARNFGLIWPKIKLFERFGGIFSLFGFIIKHLFKLNGFEMTPCFCFRRSSFRDQSLRRFVPGLLRLQLGSKAPSIVSMYRSGWLRWRKWASSKNGIPVNPAKPLYIALFINELTNERVENNMGVSPIEPTLSGIKWGHTMAGMESCPTGRPLVRSSVEAAKRKLARPVQPLFADRVQAIADA